MEEQNEYWRREKGKADAYQESLPPSDQADLSSGPAILSGVPEPLRALLYHFPTHRHHPLASRTGRPLWLSLSPSHVPRQGAALSQYASRCARLARLYLWSRCGAAGRPIAAGTASDGR